MSIGADDTVSPRRGAPAAMPPRPVHVGAGRLPRPTRLDPPLNLPYKQALDEVRVLRRTRRAPNSGWRRALFHASGGTINLGPSLDERATAALTEAVRVPIPDTHQIAVLSLKGGVGKTTTAIALGSVLAGLRGDRVIAVDANPDFGTLAYRIPAQTRSTVRTLTTAPSTQRYRDVRAHTSRAASRLEVLAGEHDPATSTEFGEQEYRAVTTILRRFYSVILTDCGTGLTHSAMTGVLDTADTVVLVSTPAIDAARSAASTLDWLGLHGYSDLASGAVVVLNSARPESPDISVDDLEEYFRGRVRTVAAIPFDEHLASGSFIDMAALDRRTRRAYLELAAIVAADFVK